MALLVLTVAVLRAGEGMSGAERVSVVTGIPGMVAFWDFVKREEGGGRRFLAHVPRGEMNEYALEARRHWLDWRGGGVRAGADGGGTGEAGGAA